MDTARKFVKTVLERDKDNKSPAKFFPRWTFNV